MIIQPSTRRGFLTGMASLFAAPAIVSAQNLMPIKVLPFDPYMLVRGRDLVTGEWVETKLMETAGDPFAIQTTDRLYGPDEVVYMAHPPDNVFCSAKHNRRG